MGLDDAERVSVGDRAALRAWFAEHADDGRGIWLVTAKGPGARPSYDDIVEEALCVGWIDSTVRSLDADRTMTYLAPRKRGSAWSPSNKDRVERLRAAGLMRPRGLAEIERAQASGAWSALDAVQALELPPDLVAALTADPAAATTWETFPPGAKRAILAWIVTAKRPQTRAARIATTVTEAAAGRRAR